MSKKPPFDRVSAVFNSYFVFPCFLNYFIFILSNLLLLILMFPMFRTPTEWTTFVKHLSLQYVIFPVYIQSLELRSVETGGHPDRTPLNMIWDSWSRFFGLRIDLTWTRNGPGLELDNIFESFKRSQMKLRQIWEFLLLRALVTAVTSTPSEKKIIFKAQRNKTFYHWGHTHILVFILFNEQQNNV